MAFENSRINLIIDIDPSVSMTEVIIRANEETALVKEIVKSLIFCGLYGSACLCAMILYKIDSLSLVIATAIHFFVVMAGLFLLGLALDWDFDSAMAVSIFSAYVLIFVFVWSITYFVGKIRVREMNMNLQLWKIFQAGSGLRQDHQAISSVKNTEE